MEKYPEWCRTAIIGYLDWLRRSFHSSATIRHNQYSVWSFCDYLLEQGANDFEVLTPEFIKKYLAGDKHTTFRGRATRITVIRQFIGYLDDYALISHKNLHLALSSGTADSVKIVEILSDENLASIHKYREDSSSPIRLRNAAMVMTGLRLGFRASDVINLKFSDIDWARKTVSIIPDTRSYNTSIIK
jgi:site-specific recombinase XerD